MFCPLHLFINNFSGRQFKSPSTTTEKSHFFYINLNNAKIRHSISLITARLFLPHVVCFSRIQSTRQVTKRLACLIFLPRLTQFDNFYNMFRDDNRSTECSFNCKHGDAKEQWHFISCQWTWKHLSQEHTKLSIPVAAISPSAHICMYTTHSPFFYQIERQKTDPTITNKW